MWLYLPHGFVSVVQDHDNPDVLWVRARRRNDLLHLLPDHHVLRTPKADYMFRTAVTRKELARAMERVVRSLDYTNVKGAITDASRRKVYTDVWHDTLELEYARS